MSKIITVPNPLLREKSTPVLIDKKTLDLVKELKETLLGNEGKVKGVGIAAIQIGEPKRIFVAFSEGSRKFLTFINPEIIWCSKRTSKADNKKMEGCLSVPNRWGAVIRPKDVKVRYQTESGEFQVRKFSEMTAVVIQHEYDHLNGILFTDRILEQKGKIYEMVKNSDEEEELREVKI